MTKKEAAYTSRYGIKGEQIAAFPRMYYANGFDFPDIPVITNEDPTSIQAFGWGLLPGFAKLDWDLDKTRARNLNARDDKLFELATWKKPAQRQRCIVVLDGFYEYHHADKKTRVPYHITMADDQPMSMAGLWETWTNKEEGITRNTVTIVTTSANATMKGIHNNPDMIKRGGHRMPLILTEETESLWLSIDASDLPGRKQLQEIMMPISDDRLTYHTVATLQGKNGTGNSEGAIEKFDWPLIGLP